MSKINIFEYMQREEYAPAHEAIAIYQEAMRYYVPAKEALDRYYAAICPKSVVGTGTSQVRQESPKKQVQHGNR